MASREKRTIRSVNFPEELYAALKESRGRSHSSQNDRPPAKTNREMARLAVETHLGPITEACVEAGFGPDEGEKKLVRFSIDLDIDEMLEDSAERLGLDVTSVFLACLRSQFGLRVGDKRRTIELRNARKRLADK